MSQGSRRLWCFVENDTDPFPLVPPIDIVIDQLKELIREKGVGVNVPLLAKNLTLWKVHTSSD